MNDFAIDLKTRLKAIAEVTTIVGSGNNARIYPDVLRQGCTLPAIVFYEVPGTSYQHLVGISGIARAVVHVVCYGANRTAANELSNTIRVKALNSDFRGYFGSAWIHGINCSSHRNWGFDAQRDASETPRYWCERVYDIFHTEETN